MKKVWLLLSLVASLSFATVVAPSAYTGKGSSSPLTAKGDLYSRSSTADAALAIGADGLVLVADSAEATGLKWSSVAGTGDFVGPASSTDNAFCRFDGTTGKLGQNSRITADDNGLTTIAMNSIDDYALTMKPSTVDGVVRNKWSNSDGTIWFSAAADFITPGDEHISFHAGGTSSANTLVLHGNGQVMGNGLGTVSVPKFTFWTDRDTGMWSSAANTLDFSAGGVNTLELDSTTAHTLLDLRMNNAGTAAAQAKIRNRANTGSLALLGGSTTSSGSYLELFSGSHATRANLIDIGSSVGTAGTIDAANGLIQMGAASAATPSFSFGSDPDTGLYRVGANNWGLSAGGTKVLDGTATTVTVTGNLLNTALTASRVVVSDGSKNLASSTMTTTKLESLTGEQIDAFIETPSAKTYTLRGKARYAGTINKVYLATSSGTITAKLQIAGVDVTSCTAISVSSTPSDTTCTAANTFAAGDAITLVTSSNSSSADLVVSVDVTR